MAKYMYESTSNISYMYFEDDAEKYPQLSRKLNRNHCARPIVRYTHVRRKTTGMNPSDFIINIFDEVQIPEICRPYVKVYYLGSVAQTELHGNIMSYFLIRKQPDISKPFYHEYIAKHIPISNVTMAISSTLYVFKIYDIYV